MASGKISSEQMQKTTSPHDAIKRAREIREMARQTVQIAREMRRRAREAVEQDRAAGRRAVGQPRSWS